MIELKTQLSNDGIFFAGEPFSCEIILTNTGEDQRDAGQIKTSHSVESLLISPQMKTPETPSINTPASIESFAVGERRIHEQQAPNESEQASETGGKVQLSKNIRNSTFTRNQLEEEEELAHKFKADLPSLNTNFNKEDESSLSIAWGFAQIVGQFIIDPNYVNSKSFDSLRAKIMYKTPGSQGTKGGGGTLGNINQKEAKSLPLYNTPPTILFIDMELSPGESKKFVYEILLPSVLPPSHRGRVIKFQYKLLIGIQKNSTKRYTQIVSIPFRFFNRTNIDGSRPVFDLLNPVINLKDEARVTAINELPVSPFLKSPIVAHLQHESSNPSFFNSRMELDLQTTTVDNVSRNLQLSGKISYDICKNNEHVASLTLVRLSYRLGEMATAIIDFSKSSIPCYHVSAFLETHEQVDPEFALKSRGEIANHTRRCCGEEHQSVLNARRAVISIPISPHRTPDYTSTARADSKITETTSVMEGFVHARSQSSVAVEPFDCVIPLKIYGALKCSKDRPKIQKFTIK